MSLILQWKMNDNASNTTVSDSIGSNDGTFNDSSLVGHWKMNDDAANTTVADSSGNSNDGTFNDSGGDPNTDAHSVTGKINTALDFDGSDDYVDLGNVSALDFTTENFSLSFWIKTSGNNNNNDRILGFGSFNSAGYEVYVDSDGSNGTITFRTYDGSSHTSSATVPDFTQWTHIAIVKYGTNSAKIYVNESLADDSSSHVNPSSYNGNYNIMRRSAGDRYVDGTIDDVRVYDRALSSDEISNLYNSGNGTEADDADTILHSVSGKINNALTFDGSDDYITTSYLANFAKNDSFSISFWFYPENASNNEDLVAKRRITANCWSVWTKYGSVRFELNGDNVNREYASKGYSQQQWQHVVAVYNGGTNKMVIYIDGEAGTEQDYTDDGGFDNNSYNLKIGEHSGGYYFTGKIDDVRIYDHTLTQTEILAIYNNGNGTEIATPSLSNMLGTNF